MHERVGADRVEMNISNQFQAIVVDIYEDCFVAHLKYVATPGLLCIDPAGVAEGQVLHNRTQWRVLYLNDEMDILGHTAKTINPLPIALNALLE